VILFEPKPVSEELLLKVHVKELVDCVKLKWYYKGASLSVGGCVEAGEKILTGEISNALAFVVAAGHHAGRSEAWGGTYISCTGPTIINLREKFNAQRFAILDTDSHHGDGTRDIFTGDRNVLHVCFCSFNKVEDEGTKIDVDVGLETSDEEYLAKIKEVFIPLVRKFNSSMIIHIFGHDSCRGDYGDRNLTVDFFPRLAELIKNVALEVCGGRYLVITHGGMRSDVAQQIFPRIIRILAR
jgi:acetoin utilization deacetylase AcuC-like enzyme